LAVANFSSNNVTIQLNTCTSNHPPVANAGPDQTVECAGATTSVTLDGSASSDPDGDTLTYSWSEGQAVIATGVKPMVNLTSGPHTLTLTVTDPSNASATDSLTVQVEDTTPPTITLNGANPMTVECHTSFNDPFATATDGCAGAVSVTSSGSVNVNAPGSYTLTYSATDGTNAATATRTVKVVDTTPPTLTLKPAISLFPPDHTYRTVTISQMVAGVSDGCSSSLGLNDVVIEKVTSDEPDDAPGSSDGSTTKDIVIAADCKSVQLRAERDSAKNGRVYVITLRVKDSAGNTTRKDFKVSVPIGPDLPAVQDATAQTKTSRCSN